jgi:uncharacterized membrane protein
MDHLAELVGKLHPIVLHFPLALLVVAGGAEFVRLFRDSPFLARGATWLLALGAITAVLAVASGWLLAAHETMRRDQQATLEWHRWLGLATAALSNLGWVASLQISRGGWAITRRVVVFAAALLVVATGYFGGELVWGRNWFQPSEEHSH